MNQKVNSFKTITNPVVTEYKDRGSKFISYLYHVRDEDEIQLHLSEIKKLHPKANHHCYAYTIGFDRNNFRVNDDGEPSGTAGKPIYGQFLSHELYHILCIVVRYFGGTKLGVSGLINAYRESASLAISKAEFKEEYIITKVELSADYALVPHVRDFLSKQNIKILTEEYTETQSKYILEIPEELYEFYEKSLASHILHRPIEDIVNPAKEMKGITFNIYEKKENT